jgi:hypothetical protein
MRREAKLVKNKSYIMNLFDRLNPRLKDQLISEEKNFPTTIGAIINTLKSKEFIIDLTLGEAATLSMHLPDVSLDVSDLFDAFNIKK